MPAPPGAHRRSGSKRWGVLVSMIRIWKDVLLRLWRAGEYDEFTRDWAIHQTTRHSTNHRAPAPTRPYANGCSARCREMRPNYGAKLRNNTV